MCFVLGKKIQNFERRKRRDVAKEYGSFGNVTKVSRTKNEWRSPKLLNPLSLIHTLRRHQYQFDRLVGTNPKLGEWSMKYGHCHASVSVVKGTGKTTRRQRHRQRLVLGHMVKTQTTLLLHG
jgi:hypothetical protein